MASRTNTYCVLQFDDRQLAALRVRRGDRGVEVVDAFQELGNWPEEADLQEALRGFVKANGLADGPLFTVLPRYEMTARILTLPSHELSEIEGMVRLNAEEYVPYQVDDLIVDECLLERLPGGESRVLAVFAHRDLVERHVRLLHGAGLDPQEIYVSTPSLATAVMTAGKEDDERFALVHHSSGGVEVIVFGRGHLEYGRSVAFHRRGRLDEQSPEESIEDLIAEVRASLSAYRREFDEGHIDRLYVASDWTNPSVLCDGLAPHIDMPCEPAPFARTLAGASTRRTTPLTLIGAALAAEGRAALVVNLVPPSIVARRAAQGMKRTVARVAVLFGIVLLAMGVYYAQSVRARLTYIHELTAQADKLKPSAEGVLEKRRQLRVLQRQVNPAGSALEALAKVAHVAPESGLTITQFIYRRDTELVLQGRAKSVEEVDAFSSALREKAGPLFAQARRGPLKSVLEGNGQAVEEYQIKVPFPADSGEAAEDVVADE